MDANDWLEKGFALGNINSPTKHQDALNAFEKALSIDPTLITAWIYKGLALANLGRHHDSLDAFEKALSIDPKLSMAWYYRGIALYSLSRFQNALDSYENALVIDPKLESAWCNKGTTLINLGKYEESLIAIEKALSIDSNDSIAWNSKGVALINLGRNEEAVMAFEKAISINPRYVKAINSKTTALANLGRPDHSRMICRKCHADLRDWKLNVYDTNDPQKINKPVQVILGTTCTYCGDVIADINWIVSIFKVTNDENGAKGILNLLPIIDTLLFNGYTIPEDLSRIIAPVIRDWLFEQYDRESGGRYSQSHLKADCDVAYDIRNGSVIWRLD
jgi:tetratricopeptide (TPR) repeat protein